jgi:hypothetical protein
VNRAAIKDLALSLSLTAAFIAAVFGFIGLLLLPTCNADTSATAFFVAVHDGRVVDASKLVAPELSPYLRVLSPDAPRELLESDRGRTILRLHASRDTEEIGGYSGTFSELCGAVKIEGDPGTFIVDTSAWILLHKIDGAWLVADLGSSATRPDVCESGPE